MFVIFVCFVIILLNLYASISWFVFLNNKAVTSDVMEKINKELQCPICWNRLVQPKLLPCCQHTFCLKCLNSYFQGRTSGQALCPVCRMSFQLPRNGATTLENNNIASRLLEITKACQSANCFLVTYCMHVTSMCIQLTCAVTYL